MIYWVLMLCTTVPCFVLGAIGGHPFVGAVVGIAAQIVAQQTVFGHVKSIYKSFLTGER